jgi:tetratricopeptide (TPR) repeat protein
VAPGLHYRTLLCELFQKSARELDLVPGAEAESEPIFTRLGDPSLPLIPRAIPMVGRDADLSFLRSFLLHANEKERSLHVITGLPGIGKTTLAMALVQEDEIRNGFDVTLWASLGPQPNLSHHLARWGQLLGVEMAEGDDGKFALCSVIKGRKTLVILDDVWQAEDVWNLMLGVPHCVYLVTTRFPLIASQISMEPPFVLQELTMEDSMELLVKLAPQVVETKAYQDLVHIAGGLPLALTLIGNYLRIESYTGQTRRIQAALQRVSDVNYRMELTDPRLVAFESHPTLPGEGAYSLQSIIAVSEQLLDDQAKEALYALSVFPHKPHHFSEEAALSVANCTSQVLDMLCDSGLLETDGDNQYALHQVIADYASMRLTDRSVVQIRLLAYAQRFIRTHETDYERLTHETDLLLAALDIAREPSFGDQIIRLVTAFAPYLLLRGYYDLLALSLQRACEVARETGHHEEVTLLHLAGQLAQKRGKYDQARELFQQALSLARQTEASARLCALLADLGWVLWKQGHYSQAKNFLQEALELAQSIKSDDQLCKILRVLGNDYCSLGAFSQGILHLKEGLHLAQRLAHREHMCVLHLDLGVALLETCEYEQAEMFLLESFRLALQIGHREWQSLAYANLTEVELARAQYQQAQLYAQEGLRLAQQISHREWTAVHMSNLAIVQRELHNAAQAQAFFQEALVVAKSIGRPYITSSILYELALLSIEKRDLQTALSQLEDMKQTSPPEDPVLQEMCVFASARLLAAKGDLEQAIHLAERSRDHLAQLTSYKCYEIDRWLKSVSAS